MREGGNDLVNTCNLRGLQDCCAHNDTLPVHRVSRVRVARHTLPSLEAVINAKILISL
jgi:hypothetical protein